MPSTVRFTVSLFAMGLFIIFGINPGNLYAKVGLVIAGVALCVIGGYYTYIILVELDNNESDTED